jgi:hypothetical protein
LEYKASILRVTDRAGPTAQAIQAAVWGGKILGDGAFYRPFPFFLLLLVKLKFISAEPFHIMTINVQ